MFFSRWFWLALFGGICSMYAAAVITMEEVDLWTTIPLSVATIVATLWLGRFELPDYDLALPDQRKTLYYYLSIRAGTVRLPDNSSATVFALPDETVWNAVRVLIHGNEYLGASFLVLKLCVMVAIIFSVAIIAWLHLAL